MCVRREERGLYFLFLGGGVESAEIHVGRTCLLPAASCLLSLDRSVVSSFGPFPLCLISLLIK